MIQLGPVALPDDLSWVDEFTSYQPVDQVVRRRLDGGLAVYPRGLKGGRPLTLEAAADAWLTRAQALALQELAAAVGATYPLTFDRRPGLSPTVMFRHQDPPALDLRPLLDYSDPDPEDPVIGQIKLIIL